MVHLQGKITCTVESASGIPPNCNAYVKVYAIRERKMLPEKKSLFTKTPAVKHQDTVNFDHKKVRNVNGMYRQFVVQLKDKGMVTDTNLGELIIPAEELADKELHRVVCGHVGPAGHDRCVTASLHYFPGDVSSDFSTTSTDPEIAGRF